jgi:uncharacterized protein (TIGR02118 family)
MGVVLVVAYEKGSDVDLDYYRSTHLPLAFKTWETLSITGHTLMTSTGNDDPYEILLTINMESMEEIKKMGALPSELRKTLSDDIKNYTKKPPKSWVMNEV